MSDAQDSVSNRNSWKTSDLTEASDPESSFSEDLPDEPPLSLAAERGEAERVESLLKAPDADLNAVNDGGNTPLTHAARNGHIEIVKMMLQDENRIDSEHYYHAFFAAAKGGHSDVLDLLLETFGLDVNATDGSGSTALHLAANNGCAGVVKSLLATNDLDINKRDKSDLTALGRALANNHENVVELLLPREDLAWGANLGKSIEEAALDREHGYMESLLATECASVNNILDPLSWAALRGQIEVLRVLLSRGVKVNAKNRRGRTPLSWASQSGRLDSVVLLLGYGADANLKDRYGKTALWWAVMEGKEEVMKKLIPIDTSTLNMLVRRGELDSIKYMLSFGAELDHQDEEGKSALHLAALYGRLDIATLLMSEGAHLNIADDSGLTPIRIALSNGGTDLVREFLKRGADTAGVMSEDWRQSFKRRDGDGHMTILWRELGGEQRLVFARDADEVPKESAEIESLLL